MENYHTVSNVTQNLRIIGDDHCFLQSDKNSISEQTANDTAHVPKYGLRRSKRYKSTKKVNYAEYDDMDEEEIKCKICKQVMSDKSEYCQHLQEMHKEENLSEAKAGELVLNSDLDQSDEEWKIDEESSDEADDYFQVQGNRIGGQKEFVCNTCLKSFCRRRDLKKHQIHMHLQNSNKIVFHCDECNKTFKWKTNLRRHQVQCHQKYAKSCKRRAESVEEARVQHKNVPYINFVSDQHFVDTPVESFSQNKIMCQPSKRVNYIKNCDVEMKCEICQEAFSDKDKYIHHVIFMHKDEKVKRKVKAEEIVLNSDLHKSEERKIDEEANDEANDYFQIQDNGISGQKDFVCNMCSKTFCTKYTLKRHQIHMHSQNGNRPNIVFDCNKCNTSFKWETNLRRHQIKCHQRHTESPKRHTEPVVETSVRHKDVSCMNVFDKKVEQSFDMSIENFDENEGICQSPKRSDFMKQLDTERKCEICEDAFSDNDKYIQHVLLMHKDKKTKSISAPSALNVSDRNFSYNICFQSFSTESGLDNHKSELHEKSADNSLYTCDNCTFDTKWKYNLKRHQVQCYKKNYTKRHTEKCVETAGQTQNRSDHCDKIHDVLSAETYHFCDVCSKSFTDWSNFEKHLFDLEHRNAKANKIKFSCDSCSKCFEWEHKLKSHQAQCHQRKIAKRSGGPPEITAESPKYKNTSDYSRILGESYAGNTSCEMEASAGSSSGINNYRIQEDMVDKSPVKDFQLVCKLCKHTFVSYDYLSDHIRRAHPLIRKNRCNECNKRIGSRSMHRHRMEKHFNVRGKVTCVYCPQTFYSTKALKEHNWKHHKHTSSQPCLYCGREYKFLLSHKLAYHAVELLSKCCSACKKNQGKLCKLSAHEKELIENGSGRGSCQICGRMFNNTNQISSPIRKKNINYCYICDAAFDYKYILRNHELSYSHQWKQQHYLKVLYTCCGKQFPKKSELEHHLDCEHLDENTLDGNASEHNICHGNHYRGQLTETNTPGLDVSANVASGSTHSSVVSVPEDIKKPTIKLEKQEFPVASGPTDQCYLPVKVKIEQKSDLFKQETVDTSVDKSFGISKWEPLKESSTIDKDNKCEKEVEFTHTSNTSLQVSSQETCNDNDNRTSVLNKQNNNERQDATPSQCPICKIHVPHIKRMDFGRHLEDHNFVQMCVFCNLVLPEDRNVFQHITDSHSISPYATKQSCALCARFVMNYKTKHDISLQIVKMNNKNTVTWDRNAYGKVSSSSKCVTCHMDLNTWEHMHNHVKACKPDQLDEPLLNNKCDYCGLDITKEYQNFMFEIGYFKTPDECKAPVSGIHFCPVCHQECSTVYDVFVHCLFHICHPFYSCAVCTKKFRMWTYIEDHCTIVAHSKSCKFCGKTHDTEKETVDHIYKHHSDKMNYRCNVCSFGAFKHKDLMEHMNTHSNKDIQMLTCKFCGLMVKDLTVHWEVCSKSKKCPTCGKQIPQVSFRRHQKIHEPRTKTCSQCNSTRLFSKEGLAKHIDRFHNQNENNSWLCEFCGVIYHQREGLMQHRKTHLNDKTFVCELCGKAYFYNQSLVLHMCTHNKERPYKCSTCEKGFASMSNLTDHIRIHKGEKPYVCQFCKKAFTKSCNKKKHIQLVHS